ncbi:hypothetical protein B296_00057416 [Ensete ventricosum]|uniref:POX domain-containing protein n=1 Tax=Ensete ventricosum TaxID=4639 RepID=A0A426XQZ3_ENSVE|nr:hypothetical protein B296_00057416 [Ensete ventricosum]
MQGFEHSHEFFGIQPGMEIFGVPSKHQSWQAQAQAAAAASVSPWLVDNSSPTSLRPLFSGDRTQRPGGGEQPSFSLLDVRHSAALVGIKAKLLSMLEEVNSFLVFMKAKLASRYAVIVVEMDACNGSDRSIDRSGT